jgi:hypothetical protein
VACPLGRPRDRPGDLRREIAETDTRSGPSARPVTGVMSGDLINRFLVEDCTDDVRGLLLLQIESRSSGTRYLTSMSSMSFSSSPWPRYGRRRTRRRHEVRDDHDGL